LRMRAFALGHERSGNDECGECKSMGTHDAKDGTTFPANQNGSDNCTASRRVRAAIL
jgi:hypothetical protein